METEPKGGADDGVAKLDRVAAAREEAQIRWIENPHKELFKATIFAVSSDIVFLGGCVVAEYLKRLLPDPDDWLRRIIAVSQAGLFVAFVCALLVTLIIVLQIFRPAAGYILFWIKKLTPTSILKYAGMVGLGVAAVFGGALGVGIVISLWSYLAGLLALTVGGVLYLLHKIDSAPPRFLIGSVGLVAVVFGIAKVAAQLADWIYPPL